VITDSFVNIDAINVFVTTIHNLVQ
jgi:hypothetical protein